MKSLLLAALLLVSVQSMAATIVIKDGSSSGMQSMQFVIGTAMSYTKNSSTSYSGSQATVNMALDMGDMGGMGAGMPGMNQTATAAFQGSVTVISKNAVEIVTEGQNGTSDIKANATIVRDRAGNIVSIKVSDKEFARNASNLMGGSLAGAQMEQLKQFPGRIALVVGDFTCRASGSSMTCKQTLKMQLSM